LRKKPKNNPLTAKEKMTLTQTLRPRITIMFLLAAVIIPSALVAQQAPAPPSLEEQLQAQYKTVKMGGDSSGPVVIEPGTVLAVQKGGILGVPPANVVFCPAKLLMGTFSASGKVCAAMVKQNSRYFTVGEKVYITKIEVKPKNDRVSVKLIECDSCNGVQQPSSFRAQVDFIFAKGFLDNPDASKVEDAIGQVLNIDNSTPDTGQAPAAAEPQQPAATPSAPAQPVSIQIGQTIDQVVAALGQPDKMVNLGAKQIYVYKDLKVTFINGKVTDVQ
jgi:hypothetical protein